MTERHQMMQALVWASQALCESDPDGVGKCIGCGIRFDHPPESPVDRVRRLDGCYQCRVFDIVARTIESCWAVDRAASGKRGSSTEKPMATKAKLRLTRVAEFTSGGHDTNLTGVEVHFQPVYATGEDKENAEWSKWTPSGELRLTITNPLAFEQYRGKVGKAFFVEITPAE